MKCGWHCDEASGEPLTLPAVSAVKPIMGVKYTDCGTNQFRAVNVNEHADTRNAPVPADVSIVTYTE